MLIAFVGDVHGLVFHTLAALTTLQRELGRPLDLLVQVGDMAAYPDTAQMDASSQRYIEVDPSQADFSRLLIADGVLGEQIRRLREDLPGPVYFVRGNHEDFDYLAGLEVDPASGTALVDRFDAFRYVPDGNVLDIEGVRLAFLGGAEELSGQAGIYAEPYDALMQMEPGSIDVLVTHEGSWATTVGYRGDTHGSKMMSTLLEQLRPRYHVWGHAHQLVEPCAVGPTTYMGLDCLVASARWYPDARGLQPGCLGILDTSTGEFAPVIAPWLGEFETPPFDFDAWYRRTIQR